MGITTLAVQPQPGHTSTGDKKLAHGGVRVALIGSNQ